MKFDIGWDTEVVPFEVLEGKTLVSVVNNDHDEIVFRCEDGSVFAMQHVQDCCETVYVEDIEGDLTDLVGLVTQAEESTSEGDSDWGTQTWTFYRLQTAGGSAVIRWLGESNGYYSESVTLFQVEEAA